MTISKKDLQTSYHNGFVRGESLGSEGGFKKASEEFHGSKAAAQRDILKAAAELAQANAKLTYAMSRMIAEKGW